MSLCRATATTPNQRPATEDQCRTLRVVHGNRRPSEAMEAVPRVSSASTDRRRGTFGGTGSRLRWTRTLGESSVRLPPDHPRHGGAPVAFAPAAPQAGPTVQHGVDHDRLTQRHGARARCQRDQCVPAISCPGTWRAPLRSRRLSDPQNAEDYATSTAASPGPTTGSVLFDGDHAAALSNRAAFTTTPGLRSSAAGPAHRRPRRPRWPGRSRRAPRLRAPDPLPATHPSTWSGRRAPTMAPVTPGQASAQATATAAGAARAGRQLRTEGTGYDEVALEPLTLELGAHGHASRPGAPPPGLAEKAPVSSPGPHGVHTMTPVPCAAHQVISAAASRRIAENGGCSESGCPIATAALQSRTPRSERPAARTSPSSLSANMVRQYPRAGRRVRRPMNLVEVELFPPVSGRANPRPLGG